VVRANQVAHVHAELDAVGLERRLEAPCQVATGIVGLEARRPAVGEVAVVVGDHHAKDVSLALHQVGELVEVGVGGLQDALRVVHQADEAGILVPPVRALVNREGEFGLSAGTRRVRHRHTQGAVAKRGALGHRARDEAIDTEREPGGQLPTDEPPRVGRLPAQGGKPEGRRVGRMVGLPAEVRLHIGVRVGRRIEGRVGPLAEGGGEGRVCDGEWGVGGQSVREAGQSASVRGAQASVEPEAGLFLVAHLDEQAVPARFQADRIGHGIAPRMALGALANQATVDESPVLIVRAHPQLARLGPFAEDVRVGVHDGRAGR